RFSLYSTSKYRGGSAHFNSCATATGTLSPACQITAHFPKEFRSVLDLHPDVWDLDGRVLLRAHDPRNSRPAYRRRAGRSRSTAVRRTDTAGIRSTVLAVGRMG